MDTSDACTTYCAIIYRRIGVLCLQQSKLLVHRVESVGIQGQTHMMTMDREEVAVEPSEHMQAVSHKAAFSGLMYPAEQGHLTSYSISCTPAGYMEVRIIAPMYSC